MRNDQRASRTTTNSPVLLINPPDLTRRSTTADQQVDKIESKYNVSLPETYRQFLTSTDADAYRMLVGSDFEYSDLLDMRDKAEELLVESNATMKLKENDFVFVMHQGYQFLFFECLGDPDPPVFHYMEKDPDAKKVFDHFSLWLEDVKKDA